MEQLVAKKDWTIEETNEFYTSLLFKALNTISESGAAIVLGPMFINGKPEDNFKKFEEAQEKLESRNIKVFSQLPFVDYIIKDAPFRYDIKFELFYKPLIQSGKINACYLLPGWETSKGTKSEVEYAKEVGVPIYEMANL